MTKPKPKPKPVAAAPIPPEADIEDAEDVPQEPVAAAPTFADLGLSAPILQTLAELGFAAPTPIQLAAIPLLRAGRDVIGRARTGSGKTAAFGLPLLERVAAGIAAKGGPAPKSPRALILAPTRELALQVTDALRQLGEGLGLSLLTVYGGASYTPQLRGLQRGAAVVVGTPGRLIDLLERGALVLDAVEVVVLDEADEMLAMGFVEDARRLLDATPPDRQVALFSATMPPPIRAIAESTLRDPATVQVDGGRPVVDHIAQRWMAVPQQHKAEALWRLLRAEPSDATLVFVRTRVGCDEVVETLALHGVDALALHGDMAQSAREQVLGRLRDERVRVVVATDVAARGLDVDHLGHVVNFDLPDNAEVYTHRIGRTGRAGRAGRATTLVAGSQWQRFLAMASHVRADVDEVRPPDDATIALEQRRALVEELLAGMTGGGPVGAGRAVGGAGARGGGDAGEGEVAPAAPGFDDARMAVARRWVVEIGAERGLSAEEFAALALVRIADARGIALLGDVDRALPVWAPDRPQLRHLRAGRVELPQRPGPVAPAPRAPAPRAAEANAPRGPAAPERRPVEDRGPSRPAPAPPPGRERPAMPQPRRSSEVGPSFAERDVDHVELFVPVGANRGVTPSDLVGAIASAGDLPGWAIGKIRIHDKVSFVALPAAAAEQLLERTELLSLRGMRVAVLRARPAAGGRG